MVADSWFRNLFNPSRIHESDKFLEVLAFEVASLMSKLVHLWQSLTDSRISKLIEEIRNSQGIRKLVSEEDEFVTRLICSEMIDNMMHVAKAVFRLSKRCTDPNLQNLEQQFHDLIRSGTDPSSWSFSARKMEKKIKKMERLIAVNGTLYQEMESLTDLEQTLKRLKNASPEAENLSEFQKKITWKKQEVKNLKEISLWNKTYNSTILLLGKSLFTVFNRIHSVFGIQSNPAEKALDDSLQDSGSFKNFASGPLHWLSNKSQTFLSGPLKKTTGVIKNSRRIFHVPQSPLLRGRKPPVKQSLVTQVGPLDTQCKLLQAQPGTLGAAALSLHYANVIIVIEKLAASPHLISHDARDDLYNMLPGNVTRSLRTRLLPFSKNLVCDTVLAQEWMNAMGSILDWLAPLAHNMVKWQSERSFEQHSCLSRTNVLLVQTLFFANQEKTEAVISELLVGLNYVYRVNARTTMECAGAAQSDVYLRLGT